MSEFWCYSSLLEGNQHNYRLLIEKMPTGMLITSSNVQSIHLFNADNSFDLFLFGLEVALIPLMIYYTVEELLEMYRLRLMYCTKLWNLVDLSISVVSVTIVQKSLIIYLLHKIT